jgi:hypothetical protein
MNILDNHLDNYAKVQQDIKLTGKKDLENPDWTSTLHFKAYFSLQKLFYRKHLGSS